MDKTENTGDPFEELRQVAGTRFDHIGDVEEWCRKVRAGELEGEDWEALTNREIKKVRCRTLLEAADLLEDVHQVEAAKKLRSLAQEGAQG